MLAELIETRSILNPFYNKDVQHKWILFHTNHGTLRIMLQLLSSLITRGYSVDMYMTIASDCN